MDLKNIQQGIQQIVSAISAVLKIEVEVSDDKLFRVAGTGLIKRKIWMEMNGEDVVYRQCIESGTTIIIDNPGFNEICQSCSHFENCIELGEICSPIKINNIVVGVIGLIAFDTFQKDRLFNDLDANIHFLEKMADVIATKMKEHTFFNQQLLAEKKISTLLNYIDNGIIMLNQQGECEFISSAARQMLNLSSDSTPSQKTIQQLLEQKENSLKGGKIVFLNVGHFSRKLFATYHQIDDFEQGETAVIILDDPDYITSVATHISAKDKNNEDMIGTHPSINKLKELIPKIANGTMPILIKGESGTGKNFIAKYIHLSSNKSPEKFLTINCSFFSEDKLDRELFGTSYNDEHIPGKLELADGGTLLLEEIHSLPLSIQIKLLKFITDKLIFRQGAYYEVNVRIISATDKDLMTLIGEGQFRQDLYYKLNIIPFSIPALHKRKQDILPFAAYFLQQFNSKNSAPNKIFNDYVKDIFLAYSWPGNIQELANIIEYSYNFENTSVITETSLPEYMLTETSDKIQSNHQKFNLQKIEKETIKRALTVIAEKGARKEDAALLLGIGRATLFRKINQFQL